MVGVKIFPIHDCDQVIGDTGKAAQKGVFEVTSPTG
jgi:hypothetical protein